MNKKNIAFFSLVFLILVFSYSGFFKVMNFESFQLNLLKTGFFNNFSIKIIPFFIPILEFSICLLLIFKTKTGVFLTIFTLLGFTVYIILLNLTGNYSECGCGGLINNLSFPAHLGFNLFLTILSFIYFILNRNKD
uniref:MauE/DoxX family redox-associated membrane protein n=1 Tax=Roseivirga sp. TaxID=1964215 RepID=UPI0040481DD9